MTPEERATVIEECVRFALERAIKLEMGELTDKGSRLNPTAYQWRTIANELRSYDSHGILPFSAEAQKQSDACFAALSHK